MTIESLGSGTLTNILLLVLILSIWIAALWRRVPGPSDQLKARAHVIEQLLLDDAPEHNGNLNLWLTAETVLLVQLASGFGVELLASDDPAWEWIRQRRIAELARRDPTFLRRVADRFKNMPDGMRTLLLEVFKKINGAIVQPWLGGKK